jgi:ubiquinol-cytochrome c reductase cytochrome c1 subunit
MRKIIFGLFFLIYPLFVIGTESIDKIYPQKHAPIDPTNLASLQRGAKYFINFCSGCHSLQFMRYNRLADDLKITDTVNLAAGIERLNKNLIFTRANPSDSIKSSLHKKEALLWFGRIPPDLSLITRARSIDWVYNYLLGFYPDNKRPFGVNNNLVKNTTMPDPIAILRNAALIYQSDSKINGLSTKTNNNLNRQLIGPNNHKFFELKELVADLVNFLAYTAEPTKSERQSLGTKVCGFLLFFSGLVYFLKKRIWRNIK